MRRRRIIASLLASLLAATMILALPACGAQAPGAPSTTASPDTTATPAPAPAIDEDREGNPIALPGRIDTVVSIGPSINEILVGLGMAGKIVAADTFSAGVEGIDPALAVVDMMALDGEQLVNLAPDIILVTSMTKVYGEDYLKIVSDAGICVAYIPNSDSLGGIMDDIRFIAAVMGDATKGDAIAGGMETEINAIRAIGQAITEKKTVYFEIGSGPLYSFGKGVFLNEMIELVGAVNVLAAMDSWVQVSEEAVVDANPDVILTNVNYNYFPADTAAEVEDIKARPGWDALVAVQNGDVYYIDTDASSQPTHNVIKALKEMAKAVYPDKY
ncbi:MAG: ABC transporter substrate-binding protein [Oscillospiraceae bacterium]|nr:ABC transporter substrate-binding protein [Oscillospiraceae bacterium]